MEAGRLYKNTAAMVEAGVTPARQLQIDESAQAQSGRTILDQPVRKRRDASVELAATPIEEVLQ